jgi:predicted lipoprotein with Yx(FWY)xxD motif
VNPDAGFARSTGMNISQIARISATSAALALLVSCGNGDDASDTGASGSSGDLVSVASVDGTDVLVDAQDQTLYTADVEEGGRIRCVEACTSFWEPMLASAADVDQASPDLRDELGTVQRPDGESQLTYEGSPLYAFAEEGAGELTGDGFTDDFQGTTFVWAAATTGTSPEPSGSQSPDSGYGY